MWTLHDPSKAGEFRALLEGCRGIVDGMLSYEIGIVEAGLTGSVDVVLNSLFASKAALEAYTAHPVHKAASAQLATMRSARHHLDYAVPEQTAAEIEVS